MSDHHIQFWMLIVQIFAFAALSVYVFETWKLRKASQEQVRISNDLIKAAMEQVEGLSKPCLTLWSDLRDQKDAMMDLGGARGNTKARDDQGSFVVQNIGNGFAMNVTYQFSALAPAADTRVRHIRYIQNIQAGKSMTMVEPIHSYAGNWSLTMHYESIGGRKYETIVKLNSLVLTGFTFKEIKPSEISSS